ncbi:3'5'-cyclic nucleotide phosphodiesterase, partial [Thraustotheca clavata]
MDLVESYLALVNEPKVDTKTSPVKVNEICPAKLSNGQHPTPPNSAMLTLSGSFIDTKTRRSMINRTELLTVANEMTPKAPTKETSPKRKPAPHLNRLINPSDEPTETDSKQYSQNSCLEPIVYGTLHPRLISLPSLHASSSNLRLDFQQRLSDFEHVNLPLTTPENGDFDEKRLKSMSIEQYTTFSQELGLRELRVHHTKLFKLVRQYQTLFSIASSISVEIQSGDALSRIVEGSYEVLEVEHVALFLISHKTQSLQLCVSRTTSPVTLPLNKGIIGYVAKHGKSAIVQDVEKDERFDPAIDFVLGNKSTRNILCVPILDPSNIPVAVLHCTNKPTDFTDIDRMSLELIATIAGHTLHKLELYEVAMLAGRKASAMLEVVRAIATECNDLNVMIHKIIDVAKTALNCDRVSLFLCHKVKNELVCCFSYDPLLQRTVIPYGVGIAGHVANTGKILRIDDCYEDERFNCKIDLKMNYKTVSALCAPVLTHDNDMVAVIQAINKLNVKPTETQPHRSNIIPFQEEDIQMLTAFCEEIASSLRRSALETAYHQVLQGVNHMKRRDPVTLVVSSLLTVHSQAADHSQVVKRRWYVYAFRAIGRFMRRLKQKRGDQIWTGRHRTSSLLLKGTLHCKWNSEEFAFDDFTFNIFTCGNDQLNYLCVQAFVEIGLFDTFSVPEAIGIAFINRVQSGYFDNPYHSWWHGVDVFQRCFALLNRTQLLHLFQPIHVFALLISALTHDIGHPGTDNGFESATLSPLALLYNDIS